MRVISIILKPDDLQMKPITPRLAAEIIRQVISSYPNETNLDLDLVDGQVVKLADSRI